MIPSYIYSIFIFLWNFIKSLDPDGITFQEFYESQGNREMQKHAKQYEKSVTILTRKLPLELSELVLMFARMNPYVYLARQQELRGMWCDTAILILHLNPLRSLVNENDLSADMDTAHIKRIDNCKIVTFLDFTCLAHDQGFSDFPNEHNTTNNSWTYGEMVIESDDVDEIRVRVYTNLHANPNYQLHEKQFDIEDTFVSEINDLLRHNKHVRLSFNFRARFAGWVHYIKDAELKVHYLKRNIQ